MNVAMMQPTFMPAQTYFELISRADLFVLLDDFQFSIQSYHQRNRLFVNKGQVGWYSVPVERATSFKAPLNSTKIDENAQWRKKMWKRVQQAYGKALHFSDIGPAVESWLLDRKRSLCEQNVALIKLVCRLLGLKPEFRCSSQLASEARRSERVLELLRWSKADRYFAARGSFDYMHEDGVFPVEDIEVLFQSFEPQPYKQIGAEGEFVPYLSVLDALFNVGAEATLELIKSGGREPLSWEAMCHRKERARKGNALEEDGQ